MNTRSNGGITLVTPLMKWWAVIWLRIQFVVTRIWPKFLGLQVFESVYFTHWCIVKRLPSHADGGRSTRLKHKWLLWEVSYSAEVDPYIEQFAKGIPAQINRLWRTSDGFPRTESVARLRDYIMSLQFEIGHLYWAQPHATLRTILSALEVRDEHSRLVAVARAGAAAPFQQEYDAFLAAQGPPAVRILRGPKPIVVLTAVTRHKEAALAAAIKALDPAASPFAAFESVHMARVVVVGRLTRLDGMEEPQELPGKYLLLSVALSGEPEDFFECLRSSVALDRLWRNCVGYPGGDDAQQFRTYMTRHRLPVHERSQGFDDTTPTDVVAALALRKQHAEFAEHVQGIDDPVQVLDDFCAHFGIDSGGSP